MNLYRFTFTNDGEETFHNITERTEAKARAAFRASCKASGFAAPDTQVELIRENEPATKQQERDTLNAIRLMIDELGPQSYLATAFEGCFADAESNIENDFGDSMKERCEAANRRALDNEFALSEARKEIERLTSLNDELLAGMRQTESRLLSADDLTDISQLLTGKVLDFGKEVSNAAERIIEAAGQPESAAFQNAVKDHRAAKADVEYYTALLVRVNNISKAGA